MIAGSVVDNIFEWAGRRIKRGSLVVILARWLQPSWQFRHPDPDSMADPGCAGDFIS